MFCILNFLLSSLGCFQKYYDFKILLSSINRECFKSKINGIICNLSILISTIKAKAKADNIGFFFGGGGGF